VALWGLGLDDGLHLGGVRVLRLGKSVDDAEEEEGDDDHCRNVCVRCVCGLASRSGGQIYSKEGYFYAKKGERRCKGGLGGNCEKGESARMVTIDEGDWWIMHQSSLRNRPQCPLIWMDVQAALLVLALLTCVHAQDMYRDGCMLCEKMLPVCYPSCELDEMCMHTKQTCMECAKAHCVKMG
jgi:hypothetical protein